VAGVDEDVAGLLRGVAGVGDDPDRAVVIAEVAEVVSDLAVHEQAHAVLLM
jgi:hypothetical protein